MLDALLRTMTGPALPTNPTSGNISAASFTNRVPQLTKPSGDGILSFGDQGTMASNAVLLAPYGVGAANTQFNMNVFGWMVTPGGVAGVLTAAPLWVPVLLATFTACNLDTTLVGVANSDVSASNFFCNAITLGVGNSGVSVEVVSPGTSTHQMAHVIVDAKGFALLQVDFAVTTATSAQALWRKL